MEFKTSGTEWEYIQNKYYYMNNHLQYFLMFEQILDPFQLHVQFIKEKRFFFHSDDSTLYSIVIDNELEQKTSIVLLNPPKSWGVSISFY
jgi:hypothetical protein